MNLGLHLVVYQIQAMGATLRAKALVPLDLTVHFTEDIK